MKKDLTILVADRNPHVREFLKRELASEGYRIRMADNAHEVLKWAYRPDPLDLIILDPDIFDADQIELINRLQDRIPILPVVIHGFRSDNEPYAVDSENTMFIEKREDSVERLKQIANEILQK